MVPISDAIFEPTLPAKIRQRMEFENSSKMISRVARPTEYDGINGDEIFNCIWIAITAPIKIEIIITKGIESTPSFEISAIVRLPNTRHLSGNANTRCMKRQYRPKVAKELVNIIIFL
jgi:hypothetical protein